MDPENGVPQPTNIPGQQAEQPPAQQQQQSDAVMGGHPAEQAPMQSLGEQAQAPAAAPAAPALEAVYVGNTKYEVSPDVAAVLRAQQEQLQTYQSTTMTQQPPSQEIQQQGNNLGIDPDLIYTDPAKYTQLVIEQATAIAKKDIKEEYTANEGRKAFFNEFYNKNNDLKDADDIVRNELNANYAAWQNKSAAEVHDLLADKVRKRILGFVSRYGQSDNAGNSTPRTTVESGQQQQAVSTQGAPAAEEPKTASNVLRMRRAQRRGAGA